MAIVILLILIIVVPELIALIAETGMEVKTTIGLTVPVVLIGIFLVRRIKEKKRYRQLEAEMEAREDTEEKSDNPYLAKKES